MTEQPEGEVVSLAARRAQQQAREQAQVEAQARAQQQQQQQQQGGTPAPGSYPVTYTLIGLNVLVWLVMVGFGVDPSGPSGAELLDWGANIGVQTADGQWWRLVSAMFIHGGILHLVFNLYFMWVVGRACERVFTPAPYAVLYFLSGLIASLVSAAVHPASPCVGASGALFGIFGTFMAFVVRRRASLPPEFVSSIMRNALILIGINIVIGLGSIGLRMFDAKIPGIDLAGHLGGLVAGFGLGYLMSKLAEQPVETMAAARAVKLRATAVTAAVGLVLVVGGSLALPRWDNPIPTMKAAGARYDEVVAAFAAAKDEPEAVIEVLETVAIPAMDQTLDELAALDHLPAESAETIALWTRHYELRREAFRVELDGLRANDPILVAEAEDLHADALAVFDE